MIPVLGDKFLMSLTQSWQSQFHLPVNNLGMCLWLSSGHQGGGREILSRGIWERFSCLIKQEVSKGSATPFAFCLWTWLWEDMMLSVAAAISWHWAKYPNTEEGKISSQKKPESCGCCWAAEPTLARLPPRLLRFANNEALLFKSGVAGYCHLPLKAPRQRIVFLGI